MRIKAALYNADHLEYSHDLRDVPDYMLEMLKEGGLCLLELEEHLVTGDTVYGA